MDWIKKNTDRFILALFAVVLIGVAVMLFLSAQGFEEKFAESMTTPPKNDTIPAVDTAKINDAKKAFEAPTKWDSTVHGGLLFTSKRYYVNNGKLENPGENTLYTHSRTGDPIPNDFFDKANLPLLDPTVPFTDPDGDGFVNEDEWLNGGKGVTGQSTDPAKKESHPPYYTLLFVKSWIKQPFRWEFKSYDGDIKKPETIDFFINPMDLRGPTQFLKLGETVKGTNFKLKGFQFKEVDNPSTGVKSDVSELTLVSDETKEEVVLPLEKIVDSPIQFGELEYRWNKKHNESGQVIRVQRLKEFVLQPEITTKYKLLDGNQQSAVIELPDGQKYTVPQLNAPTKAAAPAPSTPSN